MREEFYSKFSAEDIELVREYLKDRYEVKRKRKKLGVVYDILHDCDLACIGCGTNAHYSGSKRLEVTKPSLKQIIYVFDKIKDYADAEGIPVFINIGGGEPFLRKDIIDVLKSAAEHFGVSGVGVDTNGTLDESFELIAEAMNYSSYVGISVNGCEEYHNWWAGNKHINAFQRSMDTIKRLCQLGDFTREKLEVTSVASSRNLEDIPALIHMLSDVGVRNYSIHRAMPVGRMFKHPELLPTNEQYFKLLIDIIKAGRGEKMGVHIHHSIESIHETLLLGLETYVPDKAGNPDIGSSIGIEPEGRLVFDPWCTSGMWKKLCSPGCIYDDKIRFENLLSSEGSVFDITQTYTARHLRCNGCAEHCSGGSRVVAAACKLVGLNEYEADMTDLLGAMSSIDPACPLYIENMEDEDDEF